MVNAKMILDWAIVGVLLSAVGGLAVGGFVDLANATGLTATQATIAGLVLTFALLGFAMKYIRGVKVK